MARATSEYKLVTIPVKFDNLQKLTKHSGLDGPKMYNKLYQLLDSIRTQYDTHLVELYVALNNDEKITTKINVFLNIFEFIQICVDCNYPCDLRKDLLDEGLQRLFRKLD